RGHGDARTFPSADSSCADGGRVMCGRPTSMPIEAAGGTGWVGRARLRLDPPVRAGACCVSGGSANALVEGEVITLVVVREVRLSLGDEGLAVNVVFLDHRVRGVAAPLVEYLFGLRIHARPVLRADVVDGLEQGVLLGLAHLVQ